MRSVECGVAAGVRSRTPGPAHRRWRDLFRTQHSALRIGSHEAEAAPRSARDLGRRRRLPPRPGWRAAFPPDPRLLSQLGVSQGPPRARRAPGGRRHYRLRVARLRRGPPHDLLRQCARGVGAGERDGPGARPRGGRRRPGAVRVTAVVPVFSPRAEPRRAVKRGYPRDAGSVRLCRNLAAVERLLYQRLVDAVVLDVKSAPAAALALPARFPRIPMFVLSAVRSDDGPLLAACGAAGFAGVLVEGVDNAVAGEWIAARTAQVARRAALADAPKLLRLTDRLQLAAWEEVLRRVGFPTQTG